MGVCLRHLRDRDTVCSTSGGLSFSCSFSPTPAHTRDQPTYCLRYDNGRGGSVVASANRPQHGPAVIVQLVCTHFRIWHRQHVSHTSHHKSPHRCLLVFFREAQPPPQPNSRNLIGKRKHVFSHGVVNGSRSVRQRVELGRAHRREVGPLLRVGLSISLLHVSPHTPRTPSPRAQQTSTMRSVA